MPSNFWSTRKTSKLHCNTKEYNIGGFGCWEGCLFDFCATLWAFVYSPSCADHCLCTEHFTIRATRWMFWWWRACSMQPDSQYEECLPQSIAINAVCWEELLCKQPSFHPDCSMSVTRSPVTHAAQARMQDRQTIWNTRVQQLRVGLMLKYLCWSLNVIASSFLYSMNTWRREFCCGYTLPLSVRLIPGPPNAGHFFGVEEVPRCAVLCRAAQPISHSFPP